ncbi:MAG: hypothetical protein J6Z80_03445 [Clostridia bacterium]|nr:hypothetical protein [Clostridia bacterium]
MKKAITILLILCFVVSAFACTNGGGNDKQTSGSAMESTPADSSQPATVETDLPITDKTYDGASFVIWVRGGNKEADLYVENDDYETYKLSAAVHKRNEDLQEKFDIKLVYEDTLDEVDKMALVADSYGHLFNDSARKTLIAAADGLLLDYSKIPYIDTTKPWYNQDSVQKLSVAGKLYAALCDFAFNYIQLMTCVYFNNQLLKDVGYTNDIYEMVDSRTWTFDKMVEIAKLGSADLDKDGDINLYWDQYGYVTQGSGGPNNVLFAQGGHISLKDENDLPYFDLANDKNEFIFSNFFEKLNGDFAIFGNGVLPRECFADGRALLCEENLGVATVAFRGSKVEYGIVPIPTFDETQRDYHCLINAFAGAIGVPVSNGDLELTGSVMEYMTKYGYDNLVNLYYESTLKARDLTGDDKFYDTSIRMVDLIKNSGCLDTIYYLGNCEGLDSVGELLRDLGGAHLMAEYDSRIEAANEKLKSTIEQFIKNAE